MVDVQLLQQAADELERLYAIEAKLPKTVDGVAVVPAMRLYYPSVEFGVSETSASSMSPHLSITTHGLIEAKHCYSTLALAQAAAQEHDDS
jgi:hypothetical protein